MEEDVDLEDEELEEEGENDDLVGGMRIQLMGTKRKMITKKKMI